MTCASADPEPNRITLLDSATNCFAILEALDKLATQVGLGRTPL